MQIPDTSARMLKAICGIENPGNNEVMPIKIK